jgi:AcrR family transcriptional regulator
MSVPARKQRTRKAPGERKQELLDSAVSVFLEKGIGEATVDDITRHAGVAKGTFYLYFESKEHLIAALRDRFVEESYAKGMALAERIGKDDWWNLVDATVESFAESMLEQGPAVLFIFQDSLSPETKEILEECDRRLNELMAYGIKAGVEAGAFKVSDPEMTARFLHHGVHGAVIEAMRYERAKDYGRIVASAKELARKILAP